jgi:hypothetical protein
VAIVAHFVSIHADHGHLDRTSKIEVVEAKMVGSFLDLNLCQTTCIVTHAKENWTSSCYSCIVWNQEEVKYVVSLLFNYYLVDDSARKWIPECPILILNENSLRAVLINKAIHELRIVSACCRFD